MNFNNQLLIALPDMEDERFSQAVILMCEHNEDGAMGLVLNHPMELETQQVFTDLNLKTPINNHLVLDGGPLNKNCGFVIHNNNKQYKSSVHIQDNLTLTTSKDLLEQIGNNEFEQQWRFALGYSGWDKDQLEAEIALNTWLTCPIDLDIIFNTDPTKIWEKSLASIGINNYQNISGIGHA